MKYEKRKKSKTVDAVQLNSLADADKILKDCQYVLSIADAYWSSKNEDHAYISMCLLDGEELFMYKGEYLAWDDKNVWTMPADKFEKKFEPMRATVYGGFTTSTSDFARYTSPHPPNHYPG